MLHDLNLLVLVWQNRPVHGPKSSVFLGFRIVLTFDRTPSMGNQPVAESLLCQGKPHANIQITETPIRIDLLCMKEELKKKECMFVFYTFKRLTSFEFFC
jgi:hypothetical protein